MPWVKFDIVSGNESERKTIKSDVYIFWQAVKFLWRHVQNLHLDLFTFSVRRACLGSGHRGAGGGPCGGHGQGGRRGRRAVGREGPGQPGAQRLSAARGRRLGRLAAGDLKKRKRQWCEVSTRCLHTMHRNHCETRIQTTIRPRKNLHTIDSIFTFPLKKVKKMMLYAASDRAMALMLLYRIDLCVCAWLL